MSVSASIRVSLFHENKINIPGSIIIPVPAQSGWRIFTTNGMVGHLPAEINTVFEWQYAPLSFESLVGIFKEKEARKETTGVCLFWQDTSIGGSFSFFYDNVMYAFSMNINEDRQLVTLSPGYGVTDFQWYIQKLLPPPQ